MKVPHPSHGRVIIISNDSYARLLDLQPFDLFPFVEQL